MFCLTQLCRICIRNDDNLIDIHDKIIDNKNNYYDILKYINPQLVTEETTVFHYICNDCRENLRNSYDFVRKCFKSKMILNDYCQRLNGRSRRPYEPSGDEDDTEKAEEIEIKVEPLCDSDDDIGDENVGVIKENKKNPEDYGDVEDPNGIETDPLSNPPDLSTMYKTVTDNGLEITITPSMQNTILRTALERDKPPNESDETKTPSVKRLIRGPDNAYECPFCQKKFTQMCHVKNHILIHTGDKPFECKLCRKRFNQSSVLKRHLTVHTGLKPYECRLCARTFSHTGNLKKHLSTHDTKQPQWECDVCRKRFNLECYLKKHMHTHDGLKRFKCDKCDKRFRESGNLKAHMTSHSNVKPYKCEYCPKAFKHSVSLIAHKNTHTIVIKQR